MDFTCGRMDIVTQQQRRVSQLHHHLVAGEFDVNATSGNGLTSSELFDCFQGRVVLVSGGSIGLGRNMAEGFAVNGAKVYISSRKKKACDDTAAELNALAAKSGKGGQVIALPADVSTLDGVVGLTTELAKRESKLHVLINNAGCTWGGSFNEYPDSAWSKVMDLNVRSMFNVTQKCAPLLEAAGILGNPARVINVSSVAGISPIKSDGPTAAYAYSASKAAVIHMSKGLASALAPRHISTNVICPGLFLTKMNAHIARNNDLKDMMKEMNPLGRNGEPSDMAGLALFLASRAGSYLNGQVISTDGGLTLGGM